MDLADQAERHRQGRLLEPVIHRADVVHDLLDVAELAVLPLPRFELEHIRQRRLRPLDLRAEHRLLPDVHRDEEVWVRQDPGDPVQASEGEVRRREEPDELAVELDRRLRRKWGRLEGDVVRRLLDEAARAHGTACLTMGQRLPPY